MDELKFIAMKWIQYIVKSVPNLVYMDFLVLLTFWIFSKWSTIQAAMAMSVILWHLGKNEKCFLGNYKSIKKQTRTETGAIYKMCSFGQMQKIIFFLLLQSGSWYGNQEIAGLISRPLWTQAINKILPLFNPISISAYTTCAQRQFPQMSPDLDWTPTNVSLWLYKALKANCDVKCLSGHISS